MERMKCMKDKLIEVAYEEQMLTDDDMANLQMQVLQLLDERAYKYNGSDSSSIRKEIMVKDLSEAIYYCEVAKAMQHSTVPETKEKMAQYAMPHTTPPIS